jgi:hypothetical protein
MTDFENRLDEQVCEDYFEKMFGGNIWTQASLAAILFPNKDYKQSEAYKQFNEDNREKTGDETDPDYLEEQKSLEDLLKACDFQMMKDFYQEMIDRNRRERYKRTDLEFLARYLGDCLWGVFSNNHSVVTQEDVEFNIGSWRGAGGFIADFINKHIHKKSFDYLHFYLGHSNYFDSTHAEAKAGFQFVFSKLKAFDFDWHYEYPSMGVVDFSQQDESDLEAYDSTEKVEKEIAKQNLADALDTINHERKKEIMNAPTPPIIIAYANVFGKYPEGWID